MSNTFNDGTTIATVANMNDLIFRGNIDETEVGRVHEGMPVKLTIGALQNLSFDATLEYISPKGVEENGANQFEIKAAHCRTGQRTDTFRLFCQRRNRIGPCPENACRTGKYR